MVERKVVRPKIHVRSEVERQQLQPLEPVELVRVEPAPMRLSELAPIPEQETDPDSTWPKP